MIRLPFHTLNREHLIHYYLLSNRFPNWQLLFLQKELNPGNVSQSRFDEIFAFMSKLMSATELELGCLVDVARAQGQWNIDVETEEVLSHFDYNAAVDFSRWARMAFWNAEEAVALTLGSDPRRVTWAGVEPYVDVHPLATGFRDRMEMLKREQEVGELQANIVPADFIAWACGRFDVPAALEAAVRAVPPKRGLVAEIEALKAELAKFGEQRSEQVNPNSRTSYLKLVLGMALHHYGHRPDFPKNSTARRMHDDLAKFGISLSEETIRAILVDSAEHIDFERAD